MHLSGVIVLPTLVTGVIAALAASGSGHHPTSDVPCDRSAGSVRTPIGTTVEPQEV